MTENISKTFWAIWFLKSELFTKARVDTPQQNGLAEIENKHLSEVARALLFRFLNIFGENPFLLLYIS